MKYIKLKILTAFLVSMLSFQARAQGDVMHLFISDIPGSSTNGNFLNWIPVKSYGFEVSRALYLGGSSGLSSSGPASSGKVNVVISMTDKSIPKLFNSVCGGTVRPEIKITFATYQGVVSSLINREEIILKDVTIDGVDFYADDDLQGSVTISLVYRKIERKLLDISNQGSPTNDTEFKWDLQTGTSY